MFKKKEKVRKVEWKNKRKSFSPKEQELQYILSFSLMHTHTDTYHQPNRACTSDVQLCYVMFVRIVITVVAGPIIIMLVCAYDMMMGQWMIFPVREPSDDVWILYESGGACVCSYEKQNFTSKSKINRKVTKSNSKSGFNMWRTAGL